MKNVSISLGIIASITFILWVCVEHALGYNTTKMETGEYTRLASAFLFWLFIVLTLILKKNEVGAGLTFAQSFKAGVLMVIVYSFITAIWLAIYQHFINPDFYPLIKQFSIDQMKASGKSELQIADSMKQIEMSYNGSALSYLLYFVFSSIMGIVIALITSAIILIGEKFGKVSS